MACCMDASHEFVESKRLHENDMGYVSYICKFDAVSTKCLLPYEYGPAQAF